MPRSPQQEAVIDWVNNGQGSVIVRARAGTGKTFTLLEAMGEMNGRVAYCVFNKKNANEAEAKVGARGLNNKVVVGTFHKFGWDAWKMANRKVQILNKQGEKTNRLIDGINADPAHAPIPEEFRSFIVSAVAKAKLRGFGIFDGRINDPREWMDVVNHFDLDMELGEGGFIDRAEAVKEALRHACRVLKASIQTANEIIDFDDMIYMPLLSGVRMPVYDWVLVDEAQDSNPVRRAMVKRMLKPGGRAIFVGDDRQAIYGFTGADNDALDVISREFNTSELPLTVTYRCPKAVVSLAQTLVPDYEAHPDAPEGEVRIVSHAEMMDDPELGQGDAMICRNTAPLINIAFGLIRKGVTCHVEGREIGRGLLKLATKWKVKSLNALTDRLEDYREREAGKAMAAGQEQKAEQINDKVDTMLALIQGIGIDKTVADLVKKIQSMFADTPEGQRAPGVVLMTAHRSKGLEFPRVFLYGEGKFMPSRFARQDWQMLQEENLRYVAYTRAEKVLFRVQAL